LSAEKTRDAYHQQFDIGQRTLLDVLDSENELFDSRRAYINAKSDYLVAIAQILANSGNLLETLQLKPIETLPEPDTRDTDFPDSCDTGYETPAFSDVNRIPAHSPTAPQETAASGARDGQAGAGAHSMPPLRRPLPVDAPPQLAP